MRRITYPIGFFLTLRLIKQPQKTQNMKKTFSKFTPLAFGLLIVVGSLTTISSCSKTNANAAFIGTFAGTTVTAGTGTSSPDTIIVSAGSSSTAVTLLEKKNGTTLSGTVAGNTLTIPSQTIAIAGGNYPVNGSGALSGSTLVINLTTIISGVNVNNTFTGNKQ